MFEADLQNCDFMDINVTWNDITAKAMFYLSKRECAFILGLGFCKGFKLVTIAPMYIQQIISMEPNHVEHTSLRNQKLNVTIFKRGGRSICHVERKQETLWRISNRSFPIPSMVRLASLKGRSVSNSPQMQNLCHCPVLYRKASCLSLRRN